jgi:hypothetical protein
LVHGNDLLWEVDKTYPKEERYHARRHTVEAVCDALKVFDPAAILTTLDALSVAADLHPSSFQAWRDRLKLTNIKQFFAFVERVPEELLSQIGKRYTCDILAHNYQRVVDLGT